MTVAVGARDCALALRDLPSPPAVYAELTRLLDQRGWTVDHIADVLSADPGVTARTLRLANSPAYGLMRSVDTLQQAVSLLGLAELRQLVLATTVMERFRQIPATLLTPAVFRRRAVRAAVIARGLCDAGAAGQARRAFIGGLLHDVGSLVACLVLPERSQQVLQLHTPDPAATLPFSVERAVIGSEANELGAALLTHWRMPEALCEAIRRLPDPASGGPEVADAALFQLAARLAAMTEGETIAAVADDDPLWAVTGLDPDTGAGVPAATDDAFRELLALFSDH